MARHYSIKVGSVPAPEQPSETTWEEAFATRDWDVLDQWFDDNTGHDPATTLTTEAGANITSSWLTSREGNGRVFQENGRWVVSDYRFTAMVLMSTPNVTLRNCHLDMQNAADTSAIRSNDPTPMGLVVEHCTINGNNLNTSQSDTAIRFLGASAEDQVIIRYCDISGWRAGLYIVAGGVTAEYNWVHDLHYYPDSHNTSASIRGSNSRVYRCHLTDGNSAALSFYAENTPYTNVGAEECTFKSLHWFEVNTGLGKEFFEPQEGETRYLINNLFYNGGNYENELGYLGGVGEDIALFTSMSGNIDRFGDPISNQAPPPDPDPDPEPTGLEESWATAFATSDFAGTEPARYGDPTPAGALRTWYDANTGHDPSLDYITHTGTLTLNSAWLTANEGNGRVWQENGRWFVERYHVTGMIRFAHDNVTIRNIHHDSDGSLYALQSRAADGNAHGIVVERCTLAGNGASDNGATLNFPAARDEDQIIIRQCEISGYRAGIYCFGGITAEYNWVRDLHFSEGSHNTGASIRAGNVKLRRNLITDGNSSAISFYPEYGPYTGIVVEDNALRLATVDTGAEVIIANNRAFSELLPGETRILRNNIFYRGGNRSEGGGTGSRMDLLSEVYGNYDRMGWPISASGAADLIGSVGSRPAITSRPTSADTGPRGIILRTLTGAQAMAEVKAATADPSGRKYLRRVRISDNLNLATTGTDHLVFEDCVIEPGQSSIYAVSAFYQAGSTEPANWPEFRYCEINGGSSASLRGGWVRLLRCDMHHGTDILKPFQNMEAWGSYLHDTYRGVGAHCDSIQIVSGCSGAEFHYNNLVGYSAPDSPESPGGPISGTLQVGTITAPIGIPSAVQMTGNWVEGARMRGTGGPSDNPNNHDTQIVYRNNRFIRGTFDSGPTGNIGPDDDFDSSNVWDDTNEPVLGG